MKSVSKLLAVAIFAACTWWCVRSVPAVHAQIMSCNEYDTQDENPCDPCCLGGATEPNVTNGFVNGDGIESLSTQSLDCGLSGSCQGPNPNGYCGQTEYLQANNDADCCLPSGYPCNQGYCCGGLVCLSNNTCGLCNQDGDSCASEADCCSGFCNAETGTCGTGGCGLTDDYCSVDSDCCSYSCVGGYCE